MTVKIEGGVIGDYVSRKINEDCLSKLFSDGAGSQEWRNCKKSIKSSSPKDSRGKCRNYQQAKMYLKFFIEKRLVRRLNWSVVFAGNRAMLITWACSMRARVTAICIQCNAVVEISRSLHMLQWHEKWGENMICVITRVWTVGNSAG